MIFPDDIELFLPKYLSASSQRDLFSELNQFPDNIDKRFYSNILNDNNFIYQGDLISNVLLVDLKSQDFFTAKVLSISNSCDVNPDNKGFQENFLSVAPIFRLKAYEEGLKSKLPENEWMGIDDHIDKIRKQKVTKYFFLPGHDSEMGDGFARLDMVQSIPLQLLQMDDNNHTKLYSLSNYGFYLLVLKISIHFSRIGESIDRNVQIN